MEIQDYVPQVLKARYMPWQPLNIMALGDIQYGSEACDVDRVKRHVEWGLRHDAYFIGMGDYTDFLSPSNRARLKGAALYDTATKLIDEWHFEHMSGLYERVLRPTKGRWLGLQEGHHYHEFDEGGTSDTWLADKLEAPFLGTCGLTRVTFKDASNHRAVTTHIWSHHGEGSGATTAAPFNKLEKISGGIDADVYFMGHYSRAGCILTDRLYVAGSRTPRLRHRSRALVATGAFLRGYLQNSRNHGRAGGTYVEHAMMNPVTLGNVMVSLIPAHRDEYDTLDLEVTTLTV